MPQYSKKLIGALSSDEKQMIAFLKCHHQDFIDTLQTKIPDHQRTIREVSLNTLEVYYPYTEKDDYEMSAGWPLGFLDVTSGKWTYLGNISIYYKYDLEVVNKPKLVGSSYKYWFADSKYRLLNMERKEIINSGKTEELNFNVRFDHDSRHDDEDLIDHVSYLHNNPRVPTKKMSLSEFLLYVRNFLIPLAKAVQLEECSHIGMINRL